MRLENCIDKATRDKMNKLRFADIVKRENKARNEKLSNRDVEELMGIHRPIYERRSGAIRRK